MSETEQTEKPIIDIDERLKQEVVEYNGMTIKIEKMASFIAWRTFLDIRRSLGVAYPEFGEQIERLFRGQQAEIDEGAMSSMFFTAITLASSDDIVEIQNRVFLPLKIRLPEANIYQPFEILVKEFYQHVDVFFIGELLVRCLVVNFFASLSDLLRRWETEEKA